MSFNTRSVRGVTVIDPVGRITIGVGDVALSHAVANALAAGARNIVLNFSGVTTIDSSGVGELINARSRVADGGGSLRLSNLPARVRDTLQMAGRLNAFAVYDDEIDAVNSF